MLLGRCCKCENHKAITLKGINNSTGVTVWEYGPGSWWTQSPTAYIYGLVPDLGGTPDRYVLGVEPYGGVSSSPVRAVGTPVANVFEGITLTKLDSSDGSVADSSVVEGMFVSGVTPSRFSVASWLRIDNVVALSSGGYVVAGFRSPAIEFVDFTLNTANKTYILHSHTQQGGTVTLKTRTSNESIVLNNNATAADVKAAFEATADCTAATCTGGPWPHRAIQVDATWSVSTGDIKSIQASTTYTVSSTTRSVNGAAATYDVATGLISNSVGYVFGRQSGVTPGKLLNVTGTVPSYSAEATCNILRIVIGSSGDSVVISPVRDVAASGSSDVIDCWTVGSPWTRNWQKWTNIGISATGSDNYNLTSAQNNVVCVPFPNRTFSGNNRCGALIDIGAGTITEVDRSDAVSLTTTYNQNRATLWLTQSNSTDTNVWENELTVTDSERPNVRFENHLNGKELYLDTDTYLLGNSLTTTLSVNGVGTVANGIIGADADRIYGLSRTAGTTLNYGQPLKNPAQGIAGNVPFQWWFYMPPHQRLDTGTEWRFSFNGGGLFSAWLDWYATSSEIHTAIIDALGENTTGSFSNASVYPFGEPSGPSNSTTSMIERGLNIIFQGAGTAGALALGIPPTGYVSANRITIQFQNVTQINLNGISAWNNTDGTVAWQRKFGVSELTGLDVAWPSVAWPKGNLIIAGGELVDPD